MPRLGPPRNPVILSLGHSPGLLFSQPRLNDGKPVPLSQWPAGNLLPQSRPRQWPWSHLSERLAGATPTRKLDLPHALSCLPYHVFDADDGECCSRGGRPSSVRASSVLCESQRRFLSIQR